MNNTIIQGATAFSGSTSNVLFFRDFKEIELKNLTIRHGAYGFYPRACDKVVMREVAFKHCGSLGTETRHNQTATQAEQATYWGSSDTSDGGAVRFRTIGEVAIHNCEVSYCARGLRLQDCGSDNRASIVTGCRVYRTLEAAIYCAATSYTGSDGCTNMLITGNQILEPSNNGILVVGGKDITVSHNNVVRSANAGIMQWHSLDSRIIGNSLFDCNRSSFNGVGSLADAYGAIVVDGNSNISTTTGSHMAVIQHNSMVKCNQGRADAVYGIRAQQSVGSGVYPTASNRIVQDSNRSDAATHFDNPSSIPIVNTHEAGVTTIELGHLSGVTSAIQTQVNAKQPTLSAAQLTVANKTFSTVATDGSALCTATEIKSYVDANAGGSGGTSVVKFEHMTSFYQLPDDIQFLHWGKVAGHNQPGGNGRFDLPLFESDAPDVFTFFIFSHNPVSATGEIQLEKSNSHTFHNSCDDQEDIEFAGSGNSQVKLKNTGRNVYALTYYHSTLKWQVHRISSNITPTQIEAIEHTLVFASTARSKAINRSRRKKSSRQANTT